MWVHITVEGRKRMAANEVLRNTRRNFFTIHNYFFFFSAHNYFILWVKVLLLSKDFFFIYLPTIL